MTSREEQSFCIVIPTANRKEELFLCLESVSRSIRSYPNFSVIVVDNNVDDRISLYVKNIVGSVSSSIAYLHESKPGLTSARHSVVHRPAADVYCYVDDDVTLGHEWIESTKSAFTNPAISIAGGPSIPSFHASIPSWFWDFLGPTPYGGWCCPWLSLLDIGHDVDNINPNWIWGLNFSIRRDALFHSGGFHIDLVPKQYMRWQGDGETGLTMKLAAKGYKAVYRQDSLLFHHCGPDRLNPDYFAKRAYYQGVCNSYTELRRTLRGEQPQDSAVERDNPVQQASLLKRALRRSISTIKNRLTISPDTPAPVSPCATTAAYVRARCQQAEREGYLFHQREAAADPALRQWICRDNYIDVDLRDFAE